MSGWVSGVGYQVLGTGYRVLGIRYRVSVSGIEFRLLWHLTPDTSYLAPST
jgi:hypothetical protein